MKLTQTIIDKTFFVQHKGKTYAVNYVNSDGQTLALCNRDNWDITDEEGELLNIYSFSKMAKKDEQEIKKNIHLFEELVNFCIKNFNKYSPRESL